MDRIETEHFPAALDSVTLQKTAKVEHAVPHSRPALAIARTRMARDLLFSNDPTAEPLSENAMLPPP